MQVDESAVVLYKCNAIFFSIAFYCVTHGWGSCISLTEFGMTQVYWCKHTYLRNTYISYFLSKISSLQEPQIGKWPFLSTFYATYKTLHTLIYFMLSYFGIKKKKSVGISCEQLMWFRDRHQQMLNFCFYFIFYFKICLSFLLLALRYLKPQEAQLIVSSSILHLQFYCGSCYMSPRSM